jgi:corrinoid protein of di/trimethylamine methyltransferase
MHEEQFNAMRQGIVDGAPESARQSAHKALELGIAPLEAINKGLVPGLNSIGEQFNRGEVFLPDLVVAGEAMKAAVAVLEPEMQKRGTQREILGKVVLGTVKGDIHEIGKSLVSTLLTASGFQVFDLGVDVPIDLFVEKARDLQADLVGVSALLTTTMQGQKSVVEALDRHGLRPRVKVIVGGAPVTRDWAEKIGADGYGRDAMAAVAVAKSLLQK